MPDLQNKGYRFFVYEHTRVDTGVIFYVGKGCGNRHISSRKTHRSSHWLRIVEKAGGFSSNKIAESMDEELAFLVEAERISQLRALGVVLCNHSNGGEGVSGYKHTPESIEKMRKPWKQGRVMSQYQRSKISEMAKLRQVSEETRERMSAALSGAKNPWFGKSPSKETRARMAESQRNRSPVSEETRIKISKALSGENHPMFGKKHSPEARKKISIAKTGCVGPMLGRKFTEASKKRMSDAQLGEKSHLFGTKQPLVTCPHCGVTGGERTMARWHFSKCKKIVHGAM